LKRLPRTNKLSFELRDPFEILKTQRRKIKKQTTQFTPDDVDDDDDEEEEKIHSI
jgi:hypothetical protein